MRVFGGDRVKSLMGTFKIPDDQPIEMGMISRSLENAQSKIEGFHFDARKQILAYDDVLNQQRQEIYARRRALLLGDKKEVDEVIVELTERMPEVASVVDNKRQEFGETVFVEVFRKLTLQIMDLLWVEHLEVMGYARSSVNLRAYGQRDPLVEYRKEGVRLFAEMKDALYHRLAGTLPNVQPRAIEQQEEVRKAEAKAAQQAAGATADSKSQKRQPVEKSETFGRNDMVTISNGEETKELKYKKAELLLDSGEWQLVTKK